MRGVLPYDMVLSVPQTMRTNIKVGYIHKISQIKIFMYAFYCLCFCKVDITSGGACKFM